jgi:hypothetical protein
MNKQTGVQKTLTDGIELAGEKGKINPQNKLNDLTGAQWTHFLCSVMVTNYSTHSREGFAHDIRKIHPSPKPPQLMQEIIEFFTKRNQWVLDPFVGVGGTLLGCALSKRHGVGIDLVQDYLDAYSKVCDRLGLETQVAVRGDARHLESILKQQREINPEIPEEFDFILTDPPYSNMMSKLRTATLKRGKDRTPFSSLDTDLGNLDYDEFLAQLKLIIESAVSHLKVGKYLAIFVKDLQPNEKPNLLHADVVNSICQLGNIRFRGYKVWFDQTQKLYPFGYPSAFVANQFHQFILFFRKETE